MWTVGKFKAQSERDYYQQMELFASECLDVLCRLAENNSDLKELYESLKEDFDLIKKLKEQS